MIKEDEIPAYAGLCYYADGEIQTIKTAKRIHGIALDTEQVLRKMLRLNIQRKYLGCSMHTFLIKKQSPPKTK